MQLNTVIDAGTALAPLATAMQADGFEMIVESEANSIVLTISATPDACAECLIPKAIFKSMATKALDDSGVQIPGEITIVYPAEHHEG